MQLEVIGSSPAWPNPGGACSGYLVDRRLLLDCGPGVLSKLREREPWPSVEAIAITHLHLDHWGDVIPWVWASLFGPGRGSRPELWLPPGSLAELRPILARLGNEDMLERAFDVAEYQPAAAFVAAGLEVTALPVVHYDIDAYGFRVVGERTLGYSGDTTLCSGLREIAGGADALVMECNAHQDESPVHLTFGDVGTIRSEFPKLPLVITHRAHDVDDGGLVKVHVPEDFETVLV